MVIAAINGVVQAAVFATNKNATNGIYLGYLMLLSLWPVAELAIHYSAIDRQLPRFSKAKSREKQENSMTALLLITAIGTMALCLCFSFDRGIFGIYMLVCLYAYLAVTRAKTQTTKPVLFIYRAIRNYLQYPDSELCAHGLIRTNNGKRICRPACFAMAAMGFAFLPFVQVSKQASLVGLVIWEIGALLYVSTLLALATSFSVKRSHFPTTKIPYGEIIKLLRSSKNPHEMFAYFWGVVELDFSPVIIDRTVGFEHMHILGKTGSGKSALRLCPIIEQTISFGDMSLFAIDLKADKLEELASCMAASKELKQRTGIDMPVKVFTIQQGELSHIFNPFTTAGWDLLSTADRTSIIAEALNLHYGTDWSRGHFSSVNADIIEECLIEQPSCASFQELYSTLCNLAADKTTNIGRQKRADYVHVAQSIQKLASVNVLNATPADGTSEEALRNQIDLAEAFQTPGIYYFHLSSLTSPFIAQSVARMVTKFIMVAAKTAQRNKKVQIVIDEFQRMVSENLDGLFQLARSLDISLVIANQSLGDLRSTGDKLIQAIEGNCAIRQWLSVNSTADLELVAKLFGTQKEVQGTHTSTPQGDSVSETLRDAPRITMTDLHHISNDPFLSITQITGVRSGYSQYRGVPFVVRSDFHISEDEYNERKRFEWPNDLPGLVKVQELPQPQVSKSKKAWRSKEDTNNDVEPQDFGNLFS